MELSTCLHNPLISHVTFHKGLFASRRKKKQVRFSHVNNQIVRFYGKIRSNKNAYRVDSLVRKIHQKTNQKIDFWSTNRNKVQHTQYHIVLDTCVETVLVSMCVRMLYLNAFAKGLNYKNTSMP